MATSKIVKAAVDIPSGGDITVRCAWLTLEHLYVCFEKDQDNGSKQFAVGKQNESGKDWNDL